MSASENDVKLNIDYLCKGVYLDKLTTNQLKDDTTFINSYKNKNMQMSNGLNNILNDTKYEKIISKTNTDTLNNI
tara:strand:- start:593 stop:817 length:225 start_codon:yes stop_codon:yes gene_type:complete